MILPHSSLLYCHVEVRAKPPISVWGSMFEVRQARIHESILHGLLLLDRHGPLLEICWWLDAAGDRIELKPQYNTSAVLYQSTPIKNNLITASFYFICFQIDHLVNSYENVDCRSADNYLQPSTFINKGFLLKIYYFLLLIMLSWRGDESDVVQQQIF